MSNFSKFAQAAAVAVAITTAFATTPAFAATAHPVNLKATANGANEGAGKGSPTGTASGNFVINKTKLTFCSNIKSSGLTGINGVHIHKGAAGVDGPVAIVMNFAKFNMVGNSCVKAPLSVLKAIAASPSSYYFNAHTPDFPAGAVRGQLRK
jgi:hypothetical protein